MPHEKVTLILEKLSQLPLTQHSLLYGSSVLGLFHGSPRQFHDLDFLVFNRPEYDFVSDILRLQQEIPGTMVQASKNEWNVIVGKVTFTSENFTLGIDVSLYQNPYAEKELRSLGKISLPTLSSPCVFACKLHAIFLRHKENRSRPQDFFDVYWMIQEDIPVHLAFARFELERSELRVEIKSDLQKIVRGLPETYFENHFSQAMLLGAIERMRFI